MKTPKDLIWEYEFYTNGFHKLSGKDVKVVNVKEYKDKYVADVILIDYYDNKRERYNECEYPKDLFKNEVSMRKFKKED